MKLRWMGVALALSAMAGTAHATWIESGDVDLAIVVGGGGIEYVEADEVEVQDEMALVSVDNGGEVTVVGEGSGADRKVLGNFYVYEGVGNIQSVIGTVDVLRIGTRAGGGSIGVLNVLNSDLEGAGIQVLKGTANVTASDVPGVSLSEGTSLYATMGSRLRSLTTNASTYARLEGSLVTSPYSCDLFGTVILEDSLLRCREINIDIVGPTGSTSVDIYAFAAPSVTIDVEEEFEVNGGTVDIESAIATTGSLRVASDDAFLGIAASLWTNAGNTVIAPGDDNRIAIGAGSRFHELGFVRVAGLADSEDLTVNGAGTELEIEGDLRVGETVNLQGNPVDFLGHVTVSNGAEVVVHGTLAVRPQGVLTIESGATVYAATVENLGTIDENGGTLVVPEPNHALGGVAAIGACAWRARGRRWS